MQCYIVVVEKTSILRSSVALRHSTIGKSGLDVQILFNIYSLVDLLDAEITEVRAEIRDQLLRDTDSELHSPVSMNILSRSSCTIRKPFMDDPESQLRTGLGQHSGDEAMNGASIVRMMKAMEDRKEDLGDDVAPKTITVPLVHRRNHAE